MKNKILAAFLMSSLIAPAAFASVLNVTYINNASMPDSLAIDDMQSDSETFLFEEKQNYTLSNDLLVDQLVTTGNMILDLSSTHTDFISAGTQINSHLFSFDAVTASSTGTSWTRDIVGRFTFSSDIIAVIWTGKLSDTNTDVEYNLLESSDYLSDTTYDFGIGRGLEEESASTSTSTKDHFTVGPDFRTIDFNFKGMPQFADHLRIITRVIDVPEPTTFLLFGSALALFGFRRFS